MTFGRRIRRHPPAASNDEVIAEIVKKEIEVGVKEVVKAEFAAFEERIITRIEPTFPDHQLRDVPDRGANDDYQFPCDVFGSSTTPTAIHEIMEEESIFHVEKGTAAHDGVLATGGFDVTAGGDGNKIIHEADSREDNIDVEQVDKLINYIVQ
ncbi:hypothetical protein JRO89_XS02G0206000 [Xanthoceras sorbifolium]|uniref:Peptidase M20 dimerisation domain-containing protein n=1 Tax=Xanthoceras sorbifolium TaxID=99658 RepID=A0ABQ8IGV8_9ROSI|nr:hypothetical protein JRO89_XS02G0206000 [Xanthoceras sorbifolium]